MLTDSGWVIALLDWVVCGFRMLVSVARIYG